MALIVAKENQIVKGVSKCVQYMDFVFRQKKK